MNDTPSATPSDSAMTAERLIEDLQSLSDWDRSSNWQREIYDRAIHYIAALTAERTKLAADLTRVEGERALDAKERREMAEVYQELAGQRDDAVARALAAEAKSARLVGALKSAKATLKQFERHEKLLFEITGDEEFDKSQLAIRDLLRDEINRVTAALTLPEPSHEP